MLRDPDEKLMELQVINQNDHFEFHRLKYITEMAGILIVILSHGVVSVLG